MIPPRGIRNNNPGNLRYGTDNWLGLTGEDDAGFCIFDIVEHGIRALARTLLSYQGKHGLTTLEQIVNRWAPATENDTDAYLADVCKECGASPTNPYVLTPARLLALVVAIIRHENGEQPYALDAVQQGIAMAYL